MTAINERTAEDWGRVAMSLPGWRWMPGASFGFREDRKGLRVSDAHNNHFRVRVDGGVVQGTTTKGGSCVLVWPDGKVVEHCRPWPDPDDPATAGCLLALLGDGYAVAISIDGWVSVGSWPTLIGEGPSIGRACIAAAEALGRWPGAGK